MDERDHEVRISDIGYQISVATEAGTHVFRLHREGMRAEEGKAKGSEVKERVEATILSYVELVEDGGAPG